MRPTAAVAYVTGALITIGAKVWRVTSEEGGDGGKRRTEGDGGDQRGGKVTDGLVGLEGNLGGFLMETQPRIKRRE